jgi:predicted membrane protein
MTEFNYKTDESGIRRPSGDGRKWTGIFILLIGVAALLKSSLSDFPDWVFSWQMLLIALGFFIGLRHNFRDYTWLILVTIGGIFLINDVYPEFTFRRYMWPLALILIGIFIIVRPKHRGRHGFGNVAGIDDETFSQEDYIQGTSIFGGTKKNIISKKFKGGDLVSIFGGTELDLSQSDFTGTAIIDLTTIFGGTKLIVPSNWSVKSDAVTIFGGIDDKRKMQIMPENPDKLLLLKGTVLFGGIEIKSY